jgi:hypothetical protein
MLRAIVLIAALFVAAPSYAADARPASTTAVVVTADASTKAAPTAKVPKEVKNATDAIDKVKAAFTAAKEGHWWYFSSLVVLLVMFLLKITTLLKKIGRWKYVVNPLLSLAAALLAAFQGGVSVQTAVGVFTAAWSTGMLEELWSHGIRGKAKESKAVEKTEEPSSDEPKKPE